MTNNPMTVWAATVVERASLLRQPSMPPVPAGEPSADRLKQLLAARDVFEMDDRTLRSATVAAERLAARATGLPARTAVTDAVGELLASIDRNVAACLNDLDAAELHKLGVIRTADFGQRNDGIMLMTAQASDGGDVPLVAGRIRQLPDDHPLRKTFTEPFLWPSDLSPCVVLGPPFANLAGPWSPRAWYTLRGALDCTSLLLAGQRHREYQARERERIERLEETQRQLAHKSSMEGRVEELQRELRELKQAQHTNGVTK